MTFMARVRPAAILAVTLAVGLLLVPVVMSLYWEDSAIAFTIATAGQVLRPYTALPLYAVMLGAVAAWPAGTAGVRIAAAAVAATVGQLVITLAAFFGLRLTIVVSDIPEAALGIYEDSLSAFPWEVLALLPVAALVGAGAGWAVCGMRDDGTGAPAPGTRGASSRRGPQ